MPDLSSMEERFRALMGVTIVCEGEPEKKKGRPRIDPDKVQSSSDRDKRRKAKQKSERHRQIAVLDTETDPFDKDRPDLKIRPFVACLYSLEFDPVIIWEENFPKFVSKLIAAIEALPGKFTIYAHNGGRFDFMFLIHKIRGEISFKGRGIMSAQIGNHYLRDSYHLIPERLAAYQKEVFDYSKMRRGKRRYHKKEIVDYLISDCKYLLDLVLKFVGQFGLKMSIGQAAMCEIKKHYEVAKFTEGWDAYIRDFFFGGRVECIQGRGLFKGDWKYIDVNSMYPDVMAHRKHPIGGMTDYKIRRGAPSNDTVFIDLTCSNRGALIARNENSETTARIPYGRFKTTIWEYETALKYGLISDIKINFCIDCFKRSDFSLFVLPLYENRLRMKDELRRLKGRETEEIYIAAKRDDLFYKLLLNNGYGKFAQNPRRFVEYYITDPDDAPPDEWFKSLEKAPEEIRLQYLQPEYEADEYWIWKKPAPSWSFNNVGTAASITGAARAKLLEALQIVKRPIYCDTDSIICEGFKGVEIHKTKLGAWDLEDEFSEVVIAGKKLYSVRHRVAKTRTFDQLERGIVPEYSVKSKGVSGVTWREMLEMINGGSVEKTNFAPTLDRYGMQNYLTRNVRATAQETEN